MHPVFYFLSVYILIAGIGMAIANRKAEPSVQKQRWIKYFSYIVIIGFIILSIFYRFFIVISLLIAITGLIELVIVNFQNEKKYFAVSLLVYGLIATGFILFSLNFTTQALLFCTPI